MVVINEVTGQKLTYGDYVLFRWRERGTADERELILHLEKAVLFGGQVGGNVLLAHDGHVFPCERAGGVLAVKTVLTRAMAIANMQQQGIPFHPPPAGTNWQAPRKCPAPKVPEHYDPMQIATLAAEHAYAGMGHDRRYELCREAGIEPHGPIGDLYRVGFLAAAIVMSQVTERMIDMAALEKEAEPC